ncbi:MAG: cupin domain-containing protein [Candidatus Rokuibacteriota bacterium]
MASWTLRLTEDRLAGGGWLALPPLNRVLYLLAGDVAVTHGGQAVQVGDGQAWHGAGQSSVTTYGRGATVLRYELRQPPTEEKAPEWPGVRSRVVLEHAIALDAAQPYLMRCDRVDFAPGGEALPHGHKGGGIRYLVAGELEVRVGGAAGRAMKPGDAWFESGVEPVHAMASKTAPTAFIRVSILPRDIRGQSSIVYVDPPHAAATPRKYTVFVDEPIELG